MDDVVRWINLGLSVLVIVAGTLQIRRWPTLGPAERLHWQSSAVLNLVLLIGTAENLAAHYPGGIRIYLLPVGLIWLLSAVLYRPVSRWRAERRRLDPGRRR